MSKFMSLSLRLGSRYGLLNRHLKLSGKKTSNYCQLVKKNPNDFEVQESEDLNFNYQELNLPKDLKMSKLTNLFLKDKVEIISKPGSFTAELFLGHIDTDFLFYPKLFFDRKDYVKLFVQNAMIQQNYRDIICKENGGELLKSYGFWNLWHLSMTEQCSVYESIGASMSADILFEQLNNPNAKSLDGTDLMKIFEKDYKNHFIRFLLHNLSGSCLSFGDKDREIVKKYKALMDSGAKIGFAFNETEEKLGSLPFSDWTTEAKLSDDKTHWILNGTKNKILNDDYDHYIVFARTKSYPEDEKARYETKYQEPYDGVVCFVIDKNDLKVTTDKSNNLENNEFNYQIIQMDQLKVPRENELFEAEEYGCSALSCRGIGILTSTCYQLGVLKNLQRQLYKFLVQNKSEFLDCQAAQAELVALTESVYEIESMCYLIAAMYDTFNVKTFPDMTLETSILKSYTAKKSREFLVSVQTLLGSKLPNTFKFHDQVGLYDSLFDSGMHHRLFAASMGAHFIGVYHVNDIIKYNLPFVYPSFTLWKKWQLRKNEIDEPLIKHDVAGHVHVKLVREADKLEYCLKQLEYAGYITLDQFKKNLNNQQISLLNLSDIVTSVFVLTCALSRASRAEIEGVSNSEHEIFMARNITRRHVHKVKDLIDILKDVTHKQYELDENMYVEQVHKKNMKFNGYFPYSPIESTY